MVVGVSVQQNKETENIVRLIVVTAGGKRASIKVKICILNDLTCFMQL